MSKIGDLYRAFREANHEIESLQEYYSRTIQSVSDYKSEVESDYCAGKKASDLIESLFEIEKFEDRNARIEEINNTCLDTTGLAFKDIIAIMPFKEGSDKNRVHFVLKNPDQVSEHINPFIAKEKYENIDKYYYILTESVLSHIIVTFELFVSNVFRLMIESNPKKYFESKTMLVADLFEKSTKELMQQEIEAKVNDVMYDSLEAIQILKTKEKININTDLFDDFVELYYRRNAYIHTLGRVNEDYLKNVGKKKRNDLKINDRLECNNLYLKNAITILSKIVFSLTLELIKKEKEFETVSTLLSDYYFNKFKAGDYELSEYVYHALSCCSTLPFANRLVYRINWINAAKQLNDLDLVKKELKNLDVSAAEDQFKIAKECLSDNFELVYKMLCDDYPKSFEAQDIKEWPIFIDFRKTEFYSSFVNEHQHDFSILQMDDDQGQINDVLKEQDT